MAPWHMFFSISIRITYVNEKVQFDLERIWLKAFLQDTLGDGLGYCIGVCIYIINV